MQNVYLNQMFMTNNILLHNNKTGELTKYSKFSKLQTLFTVSYNRTPGRSTYFVVNILANEEP